MPDAKLVECTMQESTRPAPLRGRRVVEFAGVGLAGALAVRLLAEQGAQVTRIEWLGREEADTPLSRYLHAGKERVHLDLNDSERRAEAIRLLRVADVSVENFRPGTMERLGLSPQVCRAANPALIYLRLPGFASSDATHREAPGWEGALGAACGLFTDVNILRHVLGFPPVFTALPHASVYGAVHGAVAVCLALLAREGSGAGDVIEVPLAAAGASAMGSAALGISPQPRRYDIPKWSRILSRVVMPALRPLLGRLPRSLQQRIAARADAAVPALMSNYRCGDGRLLYIFAVDHDRIPRLLLETLGLWPRLRAEGLAELDQYEKTKKRKRNNIADSTRLSRRWQGRLRSALAACFAARPAAEWEALLNASGIPCSVQRETGEWLRQPALREAGIVQVSGRGDLAPGPAVWVVGQGDQPIERPSATVSRGKAEGPRLAGRVVLDLTSMVAGPVCGRTLAEYGAEVIKIDSPRPHHGPRLTCWYGVDVNQGKRSMLLDLASAPGRALLDRLLLRADIVVHNFSEPACERLRLRTAELLAVNPRLVVMHIGAFRGPHPGPFDTRKGYDPVLQAASGIMVRYGSEAAPIHHGIASCVDYLTGYLAALGTALALLQRTRGDGSGCEAATSLAQAAQLIQLPFCVADEHGLAEQGVSGQWAWGSHPLSRLYRARDGWIFLAAPPAARERISATLGLAGSALADGALAQALARAIRSRGRAELAGALRDRDVAIVAVEPLDRLPTIRAERPGTPIRRGPTVYSILRRGPGGQQIRTVAPTYAWSEASPLVTLAPAPRLGADTRAVLGELGLAPDEIEALRRARVVSEAVSAQLLPD
ncbi:CoA transferase [Elioraea rosea]|uniref:CoA transferase n=1 Tax=Elioraea rosea TaxID=2492390 RepID=UPI001183C8CD|nr:CoA transferase [Elioraea rosea]